MTRFKLTRISSFALTILISISVIVLCCLISPVLSTRGQSQSDTFNQVWETVNKQFYDPNFNGIDWNALQKKYAPQVAKAQSREEAAVLINQMLSELKTSHTRFYTPDEPAYYQILGIFAPRSPDIQKQLKTLLPNDKIEYPGIGIFTTELNNKTFIRAVLDGSPAAEAGLKVGDQLLSVEDRPFQPIQSFVGIGTPVTLKIQRTSNPRTQQEIKVTPKMLDATTMFLDAMKASTQLIEREGKKIGYVHIWSYAGDQYQQQLEEDLLYGRLKDADGLVLDLREGWGGAPITVLNIYTARGPSLTNVFRDGRRYTHSSHWQKPVVMLVNEGSRSAKEVLAYSFQKYNIGPVVGSQTAGAVVAGRAFLMSDGSLLYVAVADVYVDGDQRLEGKGVTPDVVVPYSVEYAQGDDPQKERALEVALEALKQRQ